jgi:hypothetical protein
MPRNQSAGSLYLCILILTFLQYRLDTPQQKVNASKHKERMNEYERELVRTEANSRRF